MKPKRKKTWILVADGARARIFANEGGGSGLASVREFEWPPARKPTRELGVEKPGRTFESADAARHAMEPRVDWQEFEKQRFARRIARLLARAGDDRRFDALVLVAPPKVLGEFRNALDKATRARVSAEIPKDLTRLAAHELPRHLGEVVRL